MLVKNYGLNGVITIYIYEYIYYFLFYNYIHNIYVYRCIHMELM